MNDIARPITEDGDVGFDEFGQLVLRTRKQGYTILTFISDVRDAKCIICERGWEPTAEAMADQCPWSLTDSTVHESCLVRHVGLTDRRLFFNALVAAPVRFEGLKATPNRYWRYPDPWAKRPWYLARLCDHPAHFVLGWRKRVAHIEVVGAVRHKALESAFDGESVTKEFSDDKAFVHAWGDEKVRDYIARIARVCGFVKEVPA